MMKYWRSIAVSLTIVAVIFDFWDVFITSPMALNIMLAFIGLGFAIVTVGLDFQDEFIDIQKECIKAQQDFIDNNLWAALEAVYVNGEQKGFGRNNGRYSILCTATRHGLKR